MRLLDITVENYRVHRHLRVEFAPDLTLIGGPNESGKSTLVEALHRVLFLRAKGTSEEHRAMRSHSSTGAPPFVTLRFHAQRRDWTLRKVFSGTNGTISLSCKEEPALSGEPADDRLAQLLGVEGPAGGSRLAFQWAHLWLWQGTSGQDPTDPDTTPADRLATRLQAEAGGIDLLSSPLDQRLLRRFSEDTDRYYTASGKPLVSGPLGKITTLVEDARARHTAAQERLSRYETALRECHEAADRLRSLGADLATCEREQADLKIKLDRLHNLRTQETVEAGETERLAKVHAELRQHHDDIAAKQSMLEAIADELAPLVAREEQLAALAAAAQAAFREAELQRESALERAAQARSRLEALVAAYAVHESAEHLEKLQARVRESRVRMESLTQLRSDLARLPAIDVKTLHRLEKLHGAATESRSVLKTFLTGLDVIALDGPAFLAGRPLQAGDSLELSEPTELLLGAGNRLRLRPGGGLSLSDARTAAQAADKALAEALGKFAVGDVEAARAIVTERQITQERISSAERELATPEFSRVETELTAATEKHAQAVGRATRLQATEPGLDLPADQAALAHALAQAEVESRERQSSESEATRALAVHRQKNEEARSALDTHRANLASRLSVQRNLTLELLLLRRTHGDDSTRTTRLAEASAADAQAATRLKQTRLAIAELDPAQLERTSGRLKRSLENLLGERAAQHDRLLVAQTHLRSDGIEDPVNDAAETEAELARREAEFSAVQREAEATRLLRDLYHEAQQALADRFTGPLIERTRGYLKSLFGESVQAALQHGPKGFSGFTLSRAQGAAMPFAGLSMGTREQVAAAFRLAAAEFLAADYEGTLPVVFDDAFAYADPGRVRSLQDMLDRAASRGLQILIFSCNPPDYATLGARTVILSQSPTRSVEAPDTSAPSAPRTPAIDDEIDVPDETNSAAATPTPAPGDTSALAKRLLDILQRAHDSGNPLVSSRALRQELGCDQPMFNMVRDHLVAQTQIVLEGRSQRIFTRL